MPVSSAIGEIVPSSFAADSKVRIDVVPTAITLPPLALV